MSKSSENSGEIRNFRFPFPAIDQRMVFRELIAAEVRNGRMNRHQRARIVRYAAQLGLSAVETGQLIAECQETIRPRDEQSEDLPDACSSRSAPHARTLTPRVAIVTGILLLIIWLLRL